MEWFYLAEETGSYGHRNGPSVSINGEPHLDCVCLAPSIKTLFHVVNYFSYCD